MTTDIEINEGVMIVSEVSSGVVDDVVNQSEIFETYGDEWVGPVRRAIASWAENVRVGSRAKANRGLFDRNMFVTPGKVFEQMAIAEDAMDDDVVGGIYDVTEAMAFKKISIEVEDEDQADIWSQIARDLNLDSYLRTVWRELFKVSQYYGVVLFGNKSYKVRGRNDDGRKRRKEFDIRVPIGLGVLDPTRVVPIAYDLFGNSSLVWIADEGQMDMFKDVSDHTLDDEVLEQIFLGPYNPPVSERKQLEAESIPVDRLVLLNPNNTWMGSLSKSSYERWARLRMKSVFPLLDMKHQLREMDRSFLLGGINFIVLVKKGTDEHPVRKKSEITAVAEQMRTSAKSSVIVSDHRLEIEIITPELKYILQPEKYGVLDDRIRLRLLGALAPPGDTGNRESQVTLAKVATLGISSRRHMIKRDIEKAVLRATSDLNVGVFDDNPSLEFIPRRPDMMFDSTVASEIQSIRDRGDLSRKTVLEEWDFDLNLERKRREMEHEIGDDDVFKPSNVPFDSPAKTGGETPGASGRRGGGKPAAQPKQDKPTI